MRRLLESLTPDARRIYWQWVGGMFALYVVLLLTAAGVFVGHESSRKLAQRTGHDCGNRRQAALDLRVGSMPVRQAASE